MKLKCVLLLIICSLFIEQAAVGQSNRINGLYTIPFPQQEYYSVAHNHGIYWPSYGECKAVLLCVHGLGLSAQGYTELGTSMAANGIATYAIDVRGFGQYRKTDSSYRKLDLERTANDLVKVLSELANRHPEKPIFVLGESMGGSITMKLASLNPPQLKGIICSAPAWRIYKEKRTILKAMAGWSTGSHKRVSLASKAIINEATTNKELRQQWISDETNRLDLSPAEAWQFASFIHHTHDYAKKIDNVPVLIVQGMQDRLVKVNRVPDLFRKVPSSDKELLLIANAEHLVFEEGQFNNSVINALNDWIVAKSQNIKEPPHGVLFSSTANVAQAAKLFRQAKIQVFSLVTDQVAFADN